MVAVRSVELVRLSEECVRVRGVGKRSRVPKDLRKRVLSLVTSGVSVGQVARSCGLSASLIYKWRTELCRRYRSEGLVKRLTVVSDSIKPVRSVALLVLPRPSLGCSSTNSRPVGYPVMPQPLAPRAKQMVGQLADLARTRPSFLPVSSCIQM